jgi:hypothetical protein
MATNNYSYFKVTLSTNNVPVTYMVRSDKVSEFFNRFIDYASKDISITVKGRFSTHKESRKWFQLKDNKDGKD